MIFHSPKHAWKKRNPAIGWLCVIFIGLLAGCSSPRISQGRINITITAEGTTSEIKVTSGSTVQDALEQADIVLNSLDRLDPPLYTVLSDGAQITVVRVREEFVTEQVVLPYDQLQMRNESLPEGEVHRLQPGINGLKEITYRRVFEEEQEISVTIIQETILTEAVPEIMMVGIQTPFTPVELPGKLAYFAGGNAWLMESSTSNRRPLVTSGDLDGRIFVISPDANWLMFTRESLKPADVEINTLWVIDLTDNKAQPIPLKISNVIHFADWMPGKDTTILWSTADPQQSPPGWSANNDIWQARFVPSGGTTKPIEILETNFGGQYGWWGTTFAWAPDGSRLAYSRPDGIGFINMNDGLLEPFFDITLYNTHADWAWTPGLAWGADSSSLYVVTHAPGTGLVSNEGSPNFDLSAISLLNAANVTLAPQAGMFALPVASRLRQNGDESGYEIAFMQAIFLEQSATSNYRLVVMDRDGSNRRELFPPLGQPGLEIQTAAWSPSPGANGNDLLAVTYEGNLWMIDSASGETQQVTSDGLIERLAWR